MSRKLPIAFALAALVVTEPILPAATGGTITGTVEIVDSHGKPFVFHNKKAQAVAFVYVEELTKPRHGGGKGVTSVITQEDQQFFPHRRVVPVGATVEFPNGDNVDHNVFSPDPYFDLGLYAKSKDRHPKVFDEPGEHEIYCDRHRNMWAVVKVVDTVHIAEVDAKTGAFTLDNLPDGKYRVVAWTSFSSESRSDEITIKDGSTVKADTLYLHPGRRKPHDRKDGSKYDGQYNNDNLDD